MYDIIGDVHGHATELCKLLEQLGYDRRFGFYSHPTRKALFVGDLIDRGPNIREVLQMVRAMVEHDSALAILGNHEFNALCYHTRDPYQPAEFLRSHSTKNVQQHWQTLRQLPATELYEYLEWFRTLPLWWEQDGIRVVHACWDEKRIRYLRDQLTFHSGLTTPFLQAASRQGSDLHQAIEDVLKGKELKLPLGQSYCDKDGHERHAMRIKWYESPRHQTFRGYALTLDPGLPALPIDVDTVKNVEPYPESAPPVFFGHYWLQADQPMLLGPNIVCLDYSVAKGGLLVAYRWDGKLPLSDKKFVSVRTS